MSVAMSRSDGVTVLTLTSDQSSVCPPLCQLLGALCYTPGLCSVSRRLPPQRGGPQAVLGALWIITGLLHIGLGTVIIYGGSSPSYELQYTYCPVWLGVLFMSIGVCCVLIERYPRPIFVLLCGILNLFGAAMSVTAIVWYATLLDNVGFYELCWSEDYDYWNPPTATLSPDNKRLLERCQEARLLLRSFSISLSTCLVTLSALEVCLGLSSAIIGFRSLRQRSNESGKKGSGSKGSGSKGSGSKESGSKESGSNESRKKESGNKESASKESGNKENGSKESGSKESGSKESGNNESGNNESGNNESGNNEGGNKPLLQEAEATAQEKE